MCYILYPAPLRGTHATGGVKSGRSRPFSQPIQPTRGFAPNGLEMRESLQRMFLFCWLSGALIGGSACVSSHWQAGRFDDGQVHYALPEPGDGWQRLRLDTANAAWRNPAKRAAILVNSHCVGVEDASLHVLSRHLLMGMENTEILSESQRTIAGRAALETSARGTLDGVPRQLQLLVLKKDGCVYDLVLEGNPANFDDSLPAYARLRDSWQIFRRKDWK